MGQPRLTLSIFLGAMAVLLSAIGVESTPAEAARRPTECLLARLDVEPLFSPGRDPDPWNHRVASVSPARSAPVASSAAAADRSARLAVRLASDIRHSWGLQLVQRINEANDGLDATVPGRSGASGVAVGNSAFLSASAQASLPDGLVAEKPIRAAFSAPSGIAALNRGWSICQRHLADIAAMARIRHDLQPLTGAGAALSNYSGRLLRGAARQIAARSAGMSDGQSPIAKANAVPVRKVRRGAWLGL